MSIGIYKITNIINNKCYIGQSIDINRRFSRHKTYAKNKIDYPLYKDINMFGLENFTFEIVELCHNRDLNIREKYWIDFYNSVQQGYNLTIGGQSLSIKLLKLTEDDIDNIIDMLKNRLDLSQNEIADIMAVGIDTISEINNGKTRIRNNINYPIRENKKHNYCIVCSKEILLSSIRCNECDDINKRKVDRPTREELKNLIRNNSMVKISKMFGVSDNAVRKWCAKYNLPSKSKDIKNFSDKEWPFI